MAGPNYAQAIAHSIQGQESKLLRKGELSDWRYSQIRQRHLWSNYHFVPQTPGSPILIVGGVPTVQANTYDTFVTLQNQNGQGLPQGFVMDAGDTNNLGAGRVPDDQNFAVWELGVTILPERQDVVNNCISSGVGGGDVSLGNLHPEDVDRILDEGVLQIKYLTNSVQLGHLKDFAQSGGPSIVVRSLLSSTGAASLVGAEVAGGLGEGNLAPSLAQRITRLATNSGNTAPNPGTRRKLDVPIFLPATQTYAFQVVFYRPFTLRSRKNGGTGTFQIRVDTWAVESFRQQG